MRILLVEDDAAVARIVTRTLGELSWSAKWVSTRALAVEALRDPEWDAALIDIGLPEGDVAGLTLIERIVASSPTRPVAALTATSDRAVENRLFALGVGIIKKGPGSNDALEAFLHRVASGPIDLSIIAARVLALTPRETEVCALGFAGVPRPDIAKQLGIADATVKAHRRSALAKGRTLGAKNLPQLRRQLTALWKGDRERLRPKG